MCTKSGKSRWFGTTNASSDSGPFNGLPFALLFLLSSINPCERVRKADPTHEKAGFLDFQNAGRNVAQAQVSDASQSGFDRRTHLKIDTHRAYHIWSVVLNCRVENDICHTKQHSPVRAESASLPRFCFYIQYEQLRLDP